MNKAESKQKDSSSKVLNRIISPSEHSVACTIMCSESTNIYQLFPANQNISTKLDNLLK